MKKDLTKNSCRICFKKCSDDDNNISDVATSYHELVGYKLNPADVPQKICTECFDLLFQLKLFKEKCVSAEKFLEKLRSNGSVLDDTKPIETPKKIEILENTKVEEEKSFEFSDWDDRDSPMDIGVDSDSNSNLKVQKISENDKIVSNSNITTTKITTNSIIYRKWDFQALESFLNENPGSRTTTHTFILQYEEKRPKNLPKSQDLEKYETRNDMEAVVACTYCSYKGPRKSMKDHCSKYRDTHKLKFRGNCSHEMYCLDLMRNYIFFSTKPSVSRVLLRRLRCNFCRFLCSWETTMEKHCKKMHEASVSELEMCAECGEMFYCDDLKLQHMVFRCNGGDKTLQIPFKNIWGGEVPEMREDPKVRKRLMRMKRRAEERAVRLAAKEAEEQTKQAEEQAKNEEKLRLKTEQKELYQNERIICESCGESVLRRRLKFHNEKYHSDTQYECDICGKVFKQRKGIAFHMKSVHLPKTDTGRTFPCKFCDKIFKSDSNRYVHVRRLHSTEPYKYVCQICNKRFAQNCGLKEHLTAHFDVKNFPCNLCDSVFKSGKQLWAHKNFVHSNKKFECNICYKTFKNIPALKMHKKTHGPKAHSCPICGTSYAQKAPLRKHVATNHPEYEMTPPKTVLKVEQF